MKTAIIGCGAIANTHIDVIKHLGLDLVAICDLSKEKAQALLNKHGATADIYDDYEKMFDEAKPDVVHICTPHWEHASMSIAALDRGINVLCEKPVCISREQYEAVKAAEARSTAMMGVCFQNRYLETNEKLRALAADEGAKGIFAAVPWSRDEKYYSSTDWRGRKATEGGGVMMNQAIHTLDLTLWMLGEPIAVTGTVTNNHLKGSIDEEDTAEIYIEFASGAKANFYATTASVSDTPVIISLTTNAGRYTAFGNKVFDKAGDTVVVNEKTDIIAKDYWGNGHLHLVRDYYDCLKTGRTFPIGVAEAYRAVSVILALYESYGERVKIDLSTL